MPRGRFLPPLDMTEQTRLQLESMARSRSLPHGLVRRAEIVLLAAEGWPNNAISEALGWSRATVGKWRRRFVEHGLNGLDDELRPRSASIDLGRAGGRGGIQDAADQAGGRNPMDGALHGRGDQSEQGRGPSHLAHVRLTAAPDRVFQVVYRSLLRGQGARCRWLVSQSARPCRRPVRRREEPGAGPGMPRSRAFWLTAPTMDHPHEIC